MNIEIVLPVLLAALLGSIVQRKLKEREKFNDAAKAFRDAFAKEHALLKSYSKFDSKWGVHTPDDFRKSAFIQHRVAVEQFRSFLPRRKPAAFDKAWNAYYKDEDGNDAWYQYADECTGVHDKYPRDPHLAAVERIEALLKFAKSK